MSERTLSPNCISLACCHKKIENLSVFSFVQPSLRKNEKLSVGWVATIIQKENMNNYYLWLVFFEGNTYRMENWTSCCNFITFCRDFLFFFSFMHVSLFFLLFLDKLLHTNVIHFSRYNYLSISQDRIIYPSFPLDSLGLTDEHGL